MLPFSTLTVRRAIVPVVVASGMALIAPTVQAAFNVDYTVSGGGSNLNPLNGLAGRGEWNISGNTLTIKLINTSTGAPMGFDGAASLIVSLGFDLPGDVMITVGNSAIVAPGATGINGWSARGANASIGDNWAWTNEYGGDLFAAGQALARRQLVTTSSGAGGAALARFDGLTDSIGGPEGGIAADPLTNALSPNFDAVQSAALFTLTLSRGLTQNELEATARSGVLEFGSDVRYVLVPAPASAFALLGVVPLSLRRRRR